MRRTTVELQREFKHSNGHAYACHTKRKRSARVCSTLDRRVQGGGALGAASRDASRDQQSANRLGRSMNFAALPYLKRALNFVLNKGALLRVLYVLKWIYFVCSITKISYSVGKHLTW